MTHFAHGAPQKNTRNKARTSPAKARKQPAGGAGGSRQGRDGRAPPGGGEAGHAQTNERDNKPRGGGDTRRPNHGANEGRWCQPRRAAPRTPSAARTSPTARGQSNESGEPESSKAWPELGRTPPTLRRCGGKRAQQETRRRAGRNGARAGGGGPGQHAAATGRGTRARRRRTPGCSAGRRAKRGHPRGGKPRGTRTLRGGDAAAGQSGAAYEAGDPTCDTAAPSAAASSAEKDPTPAPTMGCEPRRAHTPPLDSDRAGATPPPSPHSSPAEHELGTSTWVGVAPTSTTEEALLTTSRRSVPKSARSRWDARSASVPES